MTRLAESVTLLVISRLSMASLGPLAFVAGLYWELRLSNIDAKAETAIEISDKNSDDIVELSGEMLVVQTNQGTDRALRDGQYAAVIATLDKVNTSQTQISEAMSYIKAQVDILIGRGP